MGFEKKDYVEEMVWGLGADTGRKTQAFKWEPWRQLPWAQRHTDVTTHGSHKGLLITPLSWDLSTRKVGKRKAELGSNRTQSTVHRGEVLAFEKVQKLKTELMMSDLYNRLHFGVKAEDSLSWGRHGSHKTRWEAGEFSKERDREFKCNVSNEKMETGQLHRARHLSGEGTIKASIIIDCTMGKGWKHSKISTVWAGTCEFILKIAV